MKWGQARKREGGRGNQGIGGGEGGLARREGGGESDLVKEIGDWKRRKELPERFQRTIGGEGEGEEAKFVEGWWSEQVEGGWESRREFLGARGEEEGGQK
ncbi:hypothetical protein AMTR_s00013p00236670 [Amborella trichopoda]|uniref:Uncharacterized protein n=1 Tax=Amborella trichopoda TaxID=13333 RepID=W1PJ42_AMBTC|nr:hypothetical protein AMTR_s00013p00236670 [Amborella trichopoda]